MTQLTVEIHGTGTHNRGAEMMAIAVADRLRRSLDDLRLVVPHWFGSLEDRAKHGFLTTPEFIGGGRSRIASLALRYADPRVREKLGLVNPDEIDVVLDASGFIYSDQWNAKPARNLYRKVQGRARRRARLILLPQAMGPFEVPEVAEASRRLFERADLVFARDRESMQHLEKLGVDTPTALSPDFTMEVAPRASPDIELPERFSAIVPNFRMVDKGVGAEEYLHFLAHTVTRLRERELNPLVLLHDANRDHEVVDRLTLEEPLRVVTHEDPRVLKWILSRAWIVVGSRFHGLVGALSQGVPTIAAGWSHKYPELFADFGVPEYVLDDIEATDRLDRLLDGLGEPSHRDAVVRTLEGHAERLKQESSRMWDRVVALCREA
ncbi:MAG: polysaccharide pyruvyl transferase family protein [Gemmatimonadota bacterium]